MIAWILLPGSIGDSVRTHRAHLAATKERAELAERTREQEARRRVADERIRIARDLHDVVTHHMALANAQAGIAPHLLDRTPEKAALPERLASLTAREREVMAMAAIGLSNEEIAARMHVSPFTVRTHVHRAMAKLDARDRAQLVAIAYQSGLVRAPRPPE
ncbi:LuxR C-terminal-related transcriptional regulator [Streptomyces sp. NPDC002463]|uniref:helix-turn-helix transcriptional regulator n=1 Tax=Streptomyces sp. NPDC002463 TaxID=3364645 RepID=UPI0036C79385